MHQLPEIQWLDFLLWLLRQRRRFRVTGESMLPLLQPGEEVLVDLAAYKRSPPQVGDIIVLGHPTQTNLHIIKRVTSVNEAGLCFVLGDNQAHSSDSRTFGLISPSLVLGKVTSRFTMNNEP